jgi:hypothetical protein
VPRGRPSSATASNAVRSCSISSRLQLLAVRAGQVENVDSTLAIGRDVRRMDAVSALVDCPRKTGEQRAAVARIHFDDGRPAGGPVRRSRPRPQP